MIPENRRSLDSDERRVLGRTLMDRGFRDLFLHDPTRASAMVEVSLSPDSIDQIRRCLATIDAMDLVQRGTLTSRINSVERWKQ